MENQTAFDLNHAIQSWRENLAQSPAYRDENLNELESHLRDSVATLQTRGLSGEEAFLIAIKRLGGWQALETEFRKLNHKAIWAERLLWMLLGIQGWQAVNSLFWNVSENLLALGWASWDRNVHHWSWKEHGLALPTALFAVARLMSLAASAWCFWWLIFRIAAMWNRWFTEKLRHRGAFIGISFAASLLFLTVQAANLYLLPILYMRQLGNGPWTQASQFYQVAGYANLIALPVTIIGMSILTLMLLRKRLFNGELHPRAR